jgi:hypothetical protein
VAVPELTRAEKLVGRHFREAASKLMDVAFSEMGDEAHVYPLYLNFVRHVCPNRKGRTWAVQLREFVIFSPALWVCYCSAVVPEPHDDCQGAVFVEEMTFGYVWRAGSCSCGFMARSDSGRIILPADRQPLRGAVEVELDSTG